MSPRKEVLSGAAEVDRTPASDPDRNVSPEL